MTINLRRIVERFARRGVTMRVTGATRTADGIEATVEVRQRWFFAPALWLLGAVLRTLVRMRLAHVAAVLPILLTLSACTVRQRLRTEVAGLEGASATLDTWEEFDQAQQQRCVDIATDYDQGSTCLDAWAERARPAIAAADQLGRVLKAARGKKPTGGARTAAAALAARLAVLTAELRPLPVALTDGGSP